MGAGEARTAQRRREWIVYPERHIGCWERMTVSVKLKDQQERVGGNRRNGGRSGQSRAREREREERERVRRPEVGLMADQLTADRSEHRPVISSSMQLVEYSRLFYVQS